MTQQTSAPRAAADSGTDPRPGEQDSTADPPGAAAPAGRVSLDRLLSVVVLSPAQASLVAARVLDAIQLQGTTNGTHPGGGCLWAVALTPSGDVEVTRAGAGGGIGVTELLERLSRSARRLPTHPTPEQLVLLRRLEEATADPQLEPGARARELEGALAEVLGTGAQQRLAGQLAALVGAFAHIATSVGVPSGALTPAAPGPGRQRAAPPRPLPSRPPRHGPAPGHRHARTRRMVLIVLLLTAVLAGSGYVVLQGPEDGQTGDAGRDKNPASRAKGTASGAAQEPARPPRSPSRTGVAALAPRQAGPITGVEVRKAAACTPGTACPVTVTVRFRPASTARPVTWRVGTARSCRSDITWSPPVSVTSQPGWTRVYASSSVPASEGRSPALVAVTTAPARAQSPPVPVTGSSLRC